MYRTHKSPGTIKALVAIYIAIAMIPCGELVATLQAASPQSTHRSSGATSADQAYRIVMERGIGQHIDVQLRSGQRYKGEIQEISDEYFVVALDGNKSATDIRYGDVRQLGPIVLQPVSRSRRSIGIGRAMAGIVLVVVVEALIIHECHGKSC